MVRDDRGDWRFRASICFSIKDDRPSRLWRCRVDFRQIRDVDVARTLLAIKEWIDEPMFAENLIDCRPREMAIMAAAAEFMDGEFDAP